MKTKAFTLIVAIALVTLACLVDGLIGPYLDTATAEAQAAQALCTPPFYFIPLVSADYREEFQEDLWETEPNSNYWQADGPIGSNRNNYGYSNDERDYWILYLPAPGKIMLDLTNTSATSQLQMFYEVASEAARVAYVPEPPYHIEYTGASGVYYIMVGTTAGFNPTYPYTLRAEFPTRINMFGHKVARSRVYLDQWVGYTFDEDTENWGTSEGSYKLAVLESSQEEVCKGRRSLKLTTELRSDEGEVYRETEAVGYFDNAVPQGMDHPGPYDLTGNRVSCYVYVPEELAMETPEAFYNLFIKDTAFGNQYNARLYMTEDMADTWQQMELIVGEENDGYIDEGFDTTNVRALGIVLGIVEGSSIRFTGPVYIDHCEIEYP